MILFSDQPNVQMMAPAGQFSQRGHLQKSVSNRDEIRHCFALKHLTFCVFC